MSPLESLGLRRRLVVFAPVLLVLVGSQPAMAGRIRVLAGEIDTASTPEATAQALRAQGGRGRALAVVALDGPVPPDWRPPG
jgi:hypothetical protein